MNDTAKSIIEHGIGEVAADMPKRSAPVVQVRPAPSVVDSLAAKHRELLDAAADLPTRLEIATDDAARRLGCMPQRERVKKALLALLSDGGE